LGNSLWAEVPTGAILDTQGNRVVGSGLRIDTAIHGEFELRDAGRWYLSQGVATVRISMRESGVALDALQLDKVLAAPSDLTEVQAENFVGRQSGLSHNWWIVDQEKRGVGVLSGASGPDGAYLQSLTITGDDSSIAHVMGPESPFVEYNFFVEAPGKFDLKVRAAGIGPASNSLWVEIRAGTLAEAQGNEVAGASLRVDTSRDGTFDLRNAGQWLLDAGVVTVRISMRESGTALDAVQLIRVP
jgi:hypothetical protein